MPENTSDSFNIQPLVFEIENVIKNGLKVMLKNYIDRYDLLEKTHQQIMKLPSVMNEINKDSDSESESDTECKQNISKFINISDINDMTRDLIKNEILHLESKFDRIEKKYESFLPLISKILDKLESINDEVKVLKDNSKTEQTEDEKSYISNIIKPSVVSTCENENIKSHNEEIEAIDNIKIVHMKNEKSYIPTIKPSVVSACENENIKFEINEEYEESNEDSDNNLEDEEVVQVDEVKADEEEEVVQADEEVEADEEEVADVEEEQADVEEEQADVEEEQADVEEEQADAEEEEDEGEDEVETEASDEEENEEIDEVDTTNAPTKVEETEEELTIITIDDVDYCTNDEENGFIWELSGDGEQGDKIGYLKEGEPFFYADEK